MSDTPAEEPPPDAPPVPRRLGFRTAIGTIPVTGLTGGFERRTRLAVLVITDIAAGPNDMARTPLILDPDYDGFVAPLPGNRSPPASEVSVEAFAGAFDEVLAQLDRPAVAVGLGVGALVALAMRRPRAVLAVEPPLVTAKAWPLPHMARPNLATHAELYDKLLGVRADGVEARDYRPLLDRLACPVEVVVGEDPLLPPRQVPRVPSLVDDAERAALAAHPLVTLTVAPKTGHAVPYQAAAFLFDRLLGMCRQAALPTNPFD